MSEHHKSENTEKPLQEHGISGPQIRERAEKQFINLSALAVREKAITLFLLIAIACARVGDCANRQSRSTGRLAWH